jgi:gamma-glutamyltranspeptidase
MFDSTMSVSDSSCTDGGNAPVAGIKMSGGRLPWRDVVLPAARLAERFEVSSLLFSHFERMAPYVFSSDAMFDGLRSFVLRSDGKMHQIGDFVENKALAKLLFDIADRGPNAMYSRDIAEVISNDIKSAGGLIEPDEILRYTPKVRDPVVMSAFGYTYIGSPTPSSGGYTLGVVMKFLDGMSVSLASLGGECICSMSQKSSSYVISCSYVVCYELLWPCLFL